MLQVEGGAFVRYAPDEGFACDENVVPARGRLHLHRLDRGAMRVLVTGGTGYLGAHGVRALVDHGHDIRLLVRDPSRIDEVLGPLGLDPPDHAVGDLTDAGAVAAAMDGCDAVLHCGGMVSLARRDAEAVLATNPVAARNVIDAAIDAGLDPIIHVSSVTALFAPGVGPVHPDLPIARCASAYGRSKALAEEHARRRQAEGAPVVITYPSGVAGPPAGPLCGALSDSLGAILRAGAMPLADARVSYVDVRDTAELHARLLVPGLGPRRFVCGGHMLDGHAIAGLLRELTGRRIPVLPIPGPRGGGSGEASTCWPGSCPSTPFSPTRPWSSPRSGRGPTTDGRARLGLTYRDVEETFRRPWPVSCRPVG